MRLDITLPPDTADGISVALECAGLTHVGRQRERNEDQFLIATMQRTLEVRESSVSYDAMRWLPDSARGTILVVADGMGGAGSGDIASQVAVQAIANYLTSVLPIADAASRRAARALRDQTLPGVRQGLMRAIAKGDSAVRQAAHSPGANERMGTTLTMAYVLWPHLYVAHVGDSRCYLMREGRLEQLTSDHTLAEQLRTQTKVVIDASSPWHHVLWNALGGGEKNATAEPEVHRVSLESDDVLLLCSDGLTKHVDDASIVPALDGADNAKDACDRLVDMANAAGGSDNITAVVARCIATTPSEAAPTERPAGT
jgi:protein phosphatase